MESKKLRQFTENYLHSLQCQIIESAPTHLLSQLSIEADKDLLDRPFYWTYVDRMNLEPNPAQLCLIFDPEFRPAHGKGEYISTGSPRFRKMLASAQKQGRYVRLFQDGDARFPQPYHPWLAINFFVSYICDRKRDQIFSYGINLQSGEIQSNFYEQCRQVGWTPQLPTHHYILQQQLSLAEAVGELEYHLQEQIEAEDFTWADQAMDRLKQEMKQLDAFYDTEEQTEKQHHRRELIWQYHPRVEISLINAGLFYCVKSTFSQ